MLDLAQHFNQGPVQMGDIAKRQDVSVKYLEQLIIPLKKAGYIKSVRGPKGGHMLATSPENITVGEIVRLLEGEICLAPCIETLNACGRASGCPTRDIWASATTAMYKELDSITLSETIRRLEGDPSRGKEKGKCGP